MDSAALTAARATRRWDPNVASPAQKLLQKNASKIDDLQRGVQSQSGLDAGAIAGIVGTTVLGVLLSLTGVGVAVAPELEAAGVSASLVTTGVEEGVTEGTTLAVGEGLSEGAAGAGAGAGTVGGESSAVAASASADAAEESEAAAIATQAAARGSQSGVQIGKYTVQGLGAAGVKLGISQGISGAALGAVMAVKDAAMRNEMLQLQRAKANLVAQNAQLASDQARTMFHNKRAPIGVGSAQGSLRNPFLQETVSPSLNALFQQTSSWARGGF